MGDRRSGNGYFAFAGFQVSPLTVPSSGYRSCVEESGHERVAVMSELRTEASFPPVPASAAEARRLASQALHEWGLEVVEETTLLIVTELTSNGVRHAKTGLTLSLAYDGSRLRIGMSDHDKRPPVLSLPSAYTHHGWGLRLINNLSSDWGTFVNPNGKTVWVDLDADKLSGAQQHGVSREQGVSGNGVRPDT